MHASIENNFMNNIKLHISHIINLIPQREKPMAKNTDNVLAFNFDSTINTLNTTRLMI